VLTLFGPQGERMHVRARPRGHVAVRPELSPDPAVRAVAADDIAGGYRLRLARRAPDGRGNGTGPRGQAGELGSLLDGAAQLGDPGAQQPFGLVLGEVEQVAEPGAAAGELQAGQAAGPGVEAKLADHLAALDEAFGQAHRVEDLQRAGVDADRPGVGLVPGSGTASGGTGHSCSPEIRSDKRLLTRMRSALVSRSSRATAGAPASRCSKLSWTSRTCRSFSWLIRWSISGRSLASCNPRLCAMVDGTSFGSRTGASGTK